MRREPRILVPPELDVHQVLGARGQRAPADPSRGRRPHLQVQQIEAPAHHRLRNAPPLGRVDESEEREVREQDAPVQPEAPRQPRPVQGVGAGVQEVLDVRSVVTLALHHEGLRPDHLFDRTQRHRNAQHPRRDRVAEPVLVHRADAVAAVEDQVDVLGASRDLAQPVREAELRVALEGPGEVIEGLLDVAGAQKKVEVLHRPPDAQVALERVAAADEKVDAGCAQLAEDPSIEPVRRRSRPHRIADRGLGGIHRQQGLPHDVSPRKAATGGAGSAGWTGISTTLNGRSGYRRCSNGSATL